MIDERDLFARAAERFDPPRDAYQRFQRREDRRQRNRRVGAVVLAAVLVAAVFGGIGLAIMDGRRHETIAPPPSMFDQVRGWIAVGDHSGIEAVNPDQPRQTVLLTDRTGVPLAWSHDGQQLLLTDGPGGALWVLHSDGSIDDLPHTKGVQGGSFTPDNSAVVFVDEGEIRSMDLRTRAVTTLATKPTRGYYLLPYLHGGQLSPDGRTLVIGRPGKNWNMALFDLEDHTWLDLVDEETARRLHGTADFQGLVPASWSPDGRRILFSTEGKNDCIVAVIDVDGADLKRLTPQGTCFANPSWSPDGQRIGVTNYGDTLRIMNPDGTNVRDVHLEDGGGIAVWNPLQAAPSPSEPPTRSPTRAAVGGPSEPVRRGSGGWTR